MTTDSRYRFGRNRDTIEDIDLDREVITVDGKRYTESDALDDAHRAERRFSGLNRGGHSLSADGKHSPQVTVTLPRETRDIIAKKAAAEHMSVSKWLRLLIEHDVAAYGG